MPSGRLRLALLWVAGLDLRATILALPPLLPAIHRDLPLGETAIGLLVTLPVVMLAASAVAGSLLVARFGARAALLGGIWIVAAASAARGLGHSVGVLFIATAAMGFGVAIVQPAFPALARAWFPERAPLATGVWANGLLVGEALAATLTLPVVLPLAGGRWDGALALWGAFAAATAVAFQAGTRSERRGPPAEGRAWLPDFRSARQWQLGLVQAAASIAYFGTNAFLPDALTAAHTPALVGPALATLNAGQLPASAIVALLPARRLRHPAVFVGGAALLAASVAGFLAGGPFALAAAAAVGFTAAFVLIATFAFPATLGTPAEAARLSAGMFTIGYAGAVLASLGAGALWDATHRPESAYVPIVVAAALMLLVGPRLARW